VLAALPDALRTQVETVRATVAVAGAPGQVTLGLSGNREVHWGDADRVAEKAAVLVALLTQPGQVYDVTSPDLPTVRR
jgi:cell division protein FtsQ